MVDFWLVGSIKVWDFGSGQVIKKKSGRHSEEDLSIVGMAYTYFQGDRVLLAVGWNNKIRMLLVILCLDSFKKSEQIHFETK